MWQAIEIGWTKSKEVPTDWDDAKIKVANFNNKALNVLFNAVTDSQMRSLRRYHLLKLLRRHGPFSKQPMREPRLSKIQNFRGSLQALKISRWRRMSHSMSTMPNLRT